MTWADTNISRTTQITGGIDNSKSHPFRRMTSRSEALFPSKRRSARSIHWCRSCRLFHGTVVVIQNRLPISAAARRCSRAGGWSACPLTGCPVECPRRDAEPDGGESGVQDHDRSRPTPPALMHFVLRPNSTASTRFGVVTGVGHTDHRIGPMAQHRISRRRSFSCCSVRLDGKQHEPSWRDTIVIRLGVKGSWVRIPPSRRCEQGI